MNTHSDRLIEFFAEGRRVAEMGGSAAFADGKMFKNKDVTLVWVWERSCPGSCSNIHSVSSFSPREYPGLLVLLKTLADAFGKSKRCIGRNMVLHLKGYVKY